MFSKAFFFKVVKTWYCVLTLSQITNFRPFQTERVLSRDLNTLPENTEGKGEIACYAQFLLFLRCSQKTSIADK